MAQCLLLGGNGFIGRNLALSLANAGHSVLSADLSPVETFYHPLINYTTGDLAKPHFVDDCLKRGPFDFVFLLACTLIPSSGKDAFEKEQEFQRILGYSLPERMRKFEAETLVYFSSGGAIYGNNGINVNHENAQLCPINYYGEAKKMLEVSIQTDAPSSGIDYLIIRPSNPYGLGQKLNAAQGLIAVTLGKVLRGEPIEIWGNGEVVRDYLHVSDLTAAVIALLDQDKTRNEIYNVGSGIGKSVNQVLEIIQSNLDFPLDVRYGEARKEDVKVNVLNIDKMNSKLNWRPKVSLEQGISELWQHIRNTH
jgi:UDP-glucose 4-epimerase